jgi:tripartite-type tricarboxylate transporter receptor subunit TctC
MLERGLVFRDGEKEVVMRARMLAGLAVCILAALTGATWAAEEKWPTKPIDLVIGFPLGGSADLTARAYAPVMSRELGVPITFVYKPGGSGVLASEYVARAKPDGYTIMETSFVMQSRMPQTNPARYTFEDFTYILSHRDANWCLLVRKEAPWKDLRELVDHARKSRNVNYGTAAAYNDAHIVSEWVGRREKLDWSYVPFKGFAEVIPALLGGHIDFGGSSGGHAPLIEGGKLRTILQISGDVVDKGTKVLTLREAYPDFPAGLGMSLQGMAGPKGIPTPIVQKLANALRKATESEEFKRYTKSEYLPIVVWDSARVYKAVKDDSEEFAKFLKTIGYKKEQ